MRGGMVFVAVAAVVCGVLLGCGGTIGSHPAGGSALFAQDCSECHSLIGNESLHRQGGDLLRYRFSREDLVEFAREMPVRRPLSGVQLATLVDYLRGRERSTGRH